MRHKFAFLSCTLPLMAWCIFVWNPQKPRCAILCTCITQLGRILLPNYQGSIINNLIDGNKQARVDSCLCIETLRIFHSKTTTKWSNVCAVEPPGFPKIAVSWAASSLDWLQNVLSEMTCYGTRTRFIIWEFLIHKGLLVCPLTGAATCNVVG